MRTTPFTSNVDFNGNTGREVRVRA